MIFSSVRPTCLINLLNVFDLIVTHFLLTLRVQVLNKDSIFAFKTSLISTDTEKTHQNRLIFVAITCNTYFSNFNVSMRFCGRDRDVFPL